MASFPEESNLLLSKDHDFYDYPWSLKHLKNIKNDVIIIESR